MYDIRVKDVVANIFGSILFISILNPENANNGIYGLL